MSFQDENNRSKCPCKGCTDRYPGCHDHCEDRYKPWREERDRKNEAERKYHRGNDTMSEDQKRTLWRNKRYSRQVRYNKSQKAD